MEKAITTMPPSDNKMETKYNQNPFLSNRLTTNIHSVVQYSSGILNFKYQALIIAWASFATRPAGIRRGNLKNSTE